jgi:hypothetical protein
MRSIVRLAGVIYGHQGGWDEVLLVLVPIAVMVALLAVAKRRAERGAPVVGPDPEPGHDDG